MITIRQKNFVPYEKLENPSQHAVFYPELYNGRIIDCVSKKINKFTLACLTVGLAQVTGKVFRTKREKNPPGPAAYVFLKKCKFTIRNRKTGKKIRVDGGKGAVVIFGGMFREEWTYRTPKCIINMYEENPLPYIYLSTEERFKYSAKVKRALAKIEALPVWKQRVHDHLDLTMLGKGSYGNVYKSEVDNMKFAVKFSKLKPEALDEAFSRYVTSWYEVHFLREILRPVIRKNVCPNLPLIYDEFTCDNCLLHINDENIHAPCVITVVELAKGDLKHYLRDLKPTQDEIYSALFQIMAGIHAIQLHGQIMNYDVKKENILFYRVEPGGYWHYKIHGKNFYVPNYGYLFILNDFGISRSMSPKYPLYKSKNDVTFRLGSRYAMVKGGKFVPLNAPYQPDLDGKTEVSSTITWDDGLISKGAQFRMYRKDNSVIPIDVEMSKGMKSYLRSKKISTDPTTKTFFLKPEIIPPFEFYNDTQDGIRMFLGGKRTTQKGYHRRYPKITKDIANALEPFNGKGEGMKDHIFSTDPAQVLAGYFIEKFFTQHTNYRKIPKTPKLATYNMS